jgi:hypothetical protein
VREWPPGGQAHETCYLKDIELDDDNEGFGPWRDLPGSRLSAGAVAHDKLGVSNDMPTC